MTAAEGLRYLDSVRDADSLMGEIADAFRPILNHRAHLASETAAIQKVRDEMGRCLDEYDKFKRRIFMTTDEAVAVIAALDGILEGREK